jgi:DNA-binding MarR family transcriptional regulator
LIETGLRSATEIAKELGVATSTISKAAKRLEQKKLIERRGGNRYTTYEVRRVVNE